MVWNEPNYSSNDSAEEVAGFLRRNTLLKWQSTKRSWNIFRGELLNLKGVERTKNTHTQHTSLHTFNVRWWTKRAILITFHHQPEAKFNREFSSPWLKRALTATFFFWAAKRKKLNFKLHMIHMDVCFVFLVCKRIRDMWDKNAEQKHGTTTSKWGPSAKMRSFQMESGRFTNLKTIENKKPVKSETSRCLLFGVWRGPGSEDKFRNQALRRCLEDFGMNSVPFFFRQLDCCF